MAEDRIQVVFGAQTAELTAGTEQAAGSVAAASEEMQASLASLGAASTDVIAGMRTELESLAAPVTNITSLFKLAGEAFVAGFALDKIGGLATGLADFGEKLSRLSEETGVSTTKLSALKYGADITGTSFDNFGRVLTRFATNLQTSITTPAGPAARALQALGISQDYVRAHSDDLAGMLELVAQRLDQFAAGGNRAAIEAAIFGQRMGPELTPLLTKLAQEGFQGLIDKGREVNAILDPAMAESTRKSAEAFHEFDAAMTGLGRKIGEHLLPPLTAVARLLTAVITTVNSPEFATAWNKIASGQDAAGGLFGDLPGGGLGGGGFDVPLKPGANPFGGKPPAPPLAGSAGTPDPALITQADELEKQLNQDLQERIALIGSAQRVSDAYYQRLAADVKTAAAEGKISSAEEYQQLVTLENAKFGLLDRSLQEKLRLEREVGTEDQRLLDERAIAYEKHLQDLDRLRQQYTAQQKRAADQEARDWEQALKPIERAFDQMINAMISGHQRLRTSLLNIGGQILQDAISQDLKRLFHWIVTEMAETDAHTAGAAARAAADASATDTSITLQIADALKSIVISAWKTFAGIFGLLSPEMGPAAVGPALAGQAEVMTAASYIMQVPSMDVGAWSLPGDMLVRAHAGEMIVPASPAGAMRDWLSRFGAGAPEGAGNHIFNVNVNVMRPSASDADIARAVSRELRNFSPELTRWMRR